METNIIPYVLTVTNKGDKIEKVRLFNAEEAYRDSIKDFTSLSSENIEFHLEEGVPQPNDGRVSSYKELLMATICRNFSVNKIAIKVSSYEQLLEKISGKDYDPAGRNLDLPTLFKKEDLTQIEIDTRYREINYCVNNCGGFTIYGGTEIYYNQLPGAEVKFYFYPYDAHSHIKGCGLGTPAWKNSEK
jgi:hypothetical protein